MKVKHILEIISGISLLTISAYLAIPFVIPITLQTLALYLLFASTSKYLRLYSVLFYVLLGAIGLPIFSNFSGGFAVFQTSRGGFLVGFVCAALINHFLLTKLTIKLSLKLLFVTFIIYLVAYLFYTILILKYFDESVLYLLTFPSIFGDFFKIFLAHRIMKSLKSAPQTAYLFDLK